MQQANAAITFPLYNHLENGRFDFFLAGVSYNRLFISGTGNNFGGSNFHSISVPVIFQKSISPKYALMLSFIPTLSSDMKDVSGDDFLYTALVAFKIRTSEKFSYSLGAVYSRQFYGTLLLPLIGVDWSITKKISLSGSIPVSGKISYQVNSKNTIGSGIDLGIGGRSYRLSKEMNAGYFHMQQTKSSIFYQYSLTKSFIVQVSAGYNSDQRLDLFTKDQKVAWAPFNDLDKRIPLVETRKSSATVQSGIVYRF